MTAAGYTVNPGTAGTVAPVAVVRDPAGALWATVWRQSDGTHTAETVAGYTFSGDSVTAATDAALAAARVLDTLGERLAPYRHTAAEWHGGQSSALYALASSGRVTHPHRLAREAAAADREAWDSTTDDVHPDAYALAAVFTLAWAAAGELDTLTDGGTL